MSEVQPLSANWLSERTHLRKSLRRVDVTFYLLCTLVGLDTIGSVAAHGPQGLVWMAILAVVFFKPYGFLAGLTGKHIAGLAVIWLGVLAVAASLRIGKWVRSRGSCCWGSSPSPSSSTR